MFIWETCEQVTRYWTLPPCHFSQRVLGQLTLASAWAPLFLPASIYQQPPGSAAKLPPRLDKCGGHETPLRPYCSPKTNKCKAITLQLVHTSWQVGPKKSQIEAITGGDADTVNRAGWRLQVLHRIRAAPVVASCCSLIMFRRLLKVFWTQQERVSMADALINLRPLPHDVQTSHHFMLFNSCS